MFQGFDYIFSKKLQRVWDLVKNHQNVSISRKLAISCANYHVQGFLPNFQQKVAKKMKFSEKPPKRVDVPKTWNFLCKLPCCRVLTNSNLQQKGAKTMAFCKKTPKLVDLFKTSNFFVQTTMFQGFEQILSKKLQKQWHFVKNHQNLSISSKLATFLCKLPCFRVLSKFLAKSCKNYGIL